MLMTDMPRRTLIQTAVVLAGLIAVAPAVQAQARNHATLAMVAWTERTSQTWLLDSGYIARRSRHNQGVAVDLTLVDLHSGVEIPMGTPFDTFGDAAHTANATGAVKQSREHLVEVMASEGFTNYTMEWWHFWYVVEGPVPFDLAIRPASPTPR